MRSEGVAAGRSQSPHGIFFPVAETTSVGHFCVFRGPHEELFSGLPLPVVISVWCGCHVAELEESQGPDRAGRQGRTNLLRRPGPRARIRCAGGKRCAGFVGLGGTRHTTPPPIVPPSCGGVGAQEVTSAGTASSRLH